MIRPEVKVYQGRFVTDLDIDRNRIFGRIIYGDHLSEIDGLTIDCTVGR